VDTIVVNHLSKTFRAKQKQPGVAGSVRALWKPNYTTVTAVDGVSFVVPRGRTYCPCGTQWLRQELDRESTATTR